MKIRIDQEQCKACGLCGIVCARHVPVTHRTKDQATTTIHKERESICMRCGQCALVCPKDAISVDGIAPEDYRNSEPLSCTSDHLLSLFAHRRSVRRYKDKQIPRKVLGQIVDAAKWAPTASASTSVGIIIIDEKKKLKEFSRHLYKLYDKAERGLSSPIGRFMMTRKTGKRNIATLKSHVMPGMRWYKQWYQEGLSEEITRDCPAVMLFHTPILEPGSQANCVIAAWNAVLMAEALGVGTCYNEMIPPPCNKIPELREMLRLPDENEVFASLTMGYPKYKLKKTIRRKLSEVRYL